MFMLKTGVRFLLRDKRLFEISEVEIMRVDCICNSLVDVFLLKRTVSMFVVSIQHTDGNTKTLTVLVSSVQNI